MRWSARWKPGPFAKLAEVGLRLQGLGAGLLDESQRLRAREQAQALPRELRARDAKRERANGLDAQVDPGMPFAGEALDERVADRERGRDENLLLQRMLGADARELETIEARGRRLRLGAPQARRGSSNGRKGCSAPAHRLAAILIAIRGQTSPLFVRLALRAAR